MKVHRENNIRMVTKMRKLCPNLDKEDALDTVLEVPIPEEMFTNMGGTAAHRWQNMHSLMRAQRLEKQPTTTSRTDQFILLLKLVGSPFIPFQAQLDHAITLPIRDGTIEASTAKYIVQQYIAATGGQAALNWINSMYAVGQVSMITSDMPENGQITTNSRRSSEVGGFVLWQKNPDLWYLELAVSGYNISSGSDGKVAWSQSSSSSVVSKGPPRPLRRFFQGLDPRSTANLFLNAVCIGEKKIKDDDCFTLKLETSPEILKAQSTANTEIVHHTIWGNFCQRTGLLIQFEDTKLVRMKAAKGDDNVFYETSMESFLEDYRINDGINIAHSGRTISSIYRYGSKLSRKWKIEETWKIEEIDFNINGLSMDCFLPPSEARKEHDSEEQ
ncbi:OLC1v1017954C1 [Oldenlandia corymbosa var. corymbosa]|uniref:OLC1v1017954C1 n=1 Tax=Oldenlandia corymbosa var. corymbosa TaxID=529605 RepID=A0AAV1EAQ8_OLDCO|nr:OLC1v1017954C1 [Oldenlandia corymbosa var. corymbosa]